MKENAYIEKPVKPGVVGIHGPFNHYHFKGKSVGIVLYVSLIPRDIRYLIRDE